MRDTLNSLCCCIRRPTDTMHTTPAERHKQICKRWSQVGTQFAFRQHSQHKREIARCTTTRALFALCITCPLSKRGVARMHHITISDRDIRCIDLMHILTTSNMGRDLNGSEPHYSCIVELQLQMELPHFSFLLHLWLLLLSCPAVRAEICLPSQMKVE